MFKVHVVEAANREAYAAELEQHFRIRHDIYVGERRWLDLKRPDRREVDPFDTDDAIYLLGIEETGGVVAGSRLVPTLKPHLMSEVFPQVASARGVPRAPDIYEWTRIFVIPERRQPGRLCKAAGVLYCALVEFALDRGVRQLSVVCETYWIERLEALGWSPRMLGEPIMERDTAVVGITVDMTRRALDQTRAAYGIRDSVLAEPRKREPISTDRDASSADDPPTRSHQLESIAAS